jgi:hypothetical protein
MASEDHRIVDRIGDLTGDDLISTVARGMTAQRPSEALRTDVLRRISAPAGWRAGLRPWAVAGVAVVALAAGVAVWPVLKWGADRSRASGSGSDRQVARVTPYAGQRTPERAGALSAAAGDGAAPGQRTTARQTLANDVRDDPDSRDTVRIAPLVVTPLGIALLQPAEVDVEAVPAPETVVIGEIDVTPLRLGAMQDGLVE